MYFLVLQYFKKTPLLQTISKQSQSIVSNSTCTKIVCSKYGNAFDVVELKQEPIHSPAATEVLVNMILAPVHRADINMIQNRTPYKIDIPGTPGIEGIGVVEKIGSNVKELAPDDRVSLRLGKIGSWSTHSIFPADCLIKVRDDVDIKKQSLLLNACTAYRLLKDFVVMKSGDTIIQNGANSSVGHYIIQLCKMWGINTINVVRNRPDINKLKENLFELGATHVITEEEIRSFKQNYTINSVLALNCIGGSSAQALFTLLAKRTLYVTYGTAIGNPIPINLTIIFKDITFKGFWLTTWHNEHTPKEISNMANEITSYIKENKLTSPTNNQYIPLKDYRKAFENLLKPQNFIENKFMFDMRMQ